MSRAADVGGLGDGHEPRNTHDPEFFDMQMRERRSHAGPPQWERSDVPRPGPQIAPEGVADLDPPGDMLPLLELPEALHAAELFGLLPQAARADIVRGRL